MKEYKGFLVDDDLNIYNKRTGNKVTPYLGSDGYMGVTRRGENGKIIHERVHTIYAHCFVPNPHHYKYVNHIDSDKTNNNLDNLEWCTNSYNVKHGWHSGNRTHKNFTGIIVYTLDKEQIGEFKSIRECCREMHFDRHKVARILKKELPTDYLGYLFSYAEGQTTIENAS